MKKRLELMDIIFIVSVCLIPTLLSFFIFSGFEYQEKYILTVIFYSLFGVFEELLDFYLNNKSRKLEIKLKSIFNNLLLFCIIFMFISVLFKYNGIVDLIIEILCLTFSYFICNMAVYFIGEKN